MQTQYWKQTKALLGVLIHSKHGLLIRYSIVLKLGERSTEKESIVFLKVHIIDY
jgi:hypothetical protein